MSNQTCPLCGSGADFETVHEPYGKRFNCPSCIEFFIDPSSEKHIAELPEVTRTETRKKLSDSARSGGPTRLLVIRHPRNDELGGDGHGVARTRMIAEWVTRDG